MKNLAIVLCVIHPCTFLLAQDTINVPRDYTEIQAAINVAETGSVILVEPGTYYENLVWKEDVDGIKLVSSEGAEVTIIDGSNSGRVLSIEGSVGSLDDQDITAATEIAGFTLANGALSNASGAGLHVAGASPSLRDLIIEENSIQGESVDGAGAYIANYNGIIENCTFRGNNIEAARFSKGVGLYLGTEGDVTLRNCTFQNNHGQTDSWCYGGGLYIYSSIFQTASNNKVKMVSCLIDNNSTSTDQWSYGGGIYVDNFGGEIVLEIDSSIISNNTTNEARWSFGGGIHAPPSIKISNSTFHHNASANGSAIFYDTSPNMNPDLVAIISSSQFHDNVRIEGSSLYNVAIGGGYDPMKLELSNCIISHNKQGSIEMEGELTLNHCTIAYNQQPVTLENGWNAPLSQLRATNSIFWQNGDREFSRDIDEVNKEIKNCLVSGGIEGEQIIDSDPLFVSQNFLIPTEASPCLGAGLPTDLTEDITGGPRVLPTNSYPDLGAYEFDQYFAHVQVKFFLDHNEDGIRNMDEQYTSLGSVSFNDIHHLNNFRPEGIYFITEQGGLTVSYNNDWDPLWSATGQSEYDLTVDAEDFSELIEIGLTPTETISQVQQLVTSNRFRCGEEVDFQLIIKNKGTTVEDGIVWIQIDERITDFSFTVEPNEIDGTHRVGWYYNNLAPAECLVIDFIVTAPLITSADQVGEEYCFPYYNARNRLEPPKYTVELRCSYDPNDKAVTPSREDELALLDAEQIYKIRFQNTGNDYARKVVIRDTLDENLDLSTFDVISTSHPDQLNVTMNDGRAVAFEFDNIYLPDSTTNEPGSHGFVLYSIVPKDGLAIDAEVRNTAHIYFDFNPAIVTNTTRSIMVDAFPIVATKEQMNESVSVYPNPASEYLLFSKTVDDIRVYDSSGRVWLNDSSVDMISVLKLVDGVYFVDIRDADNLSTYKIIVAK